MQIASIIVDNQAGTCRKKGRKNVMNLHLLRLVQYKITLIEEIKRRKTPKKPDPGCSTGG